MYTLVAVCNLIHKFTEQLCLRRRTLEGIAIVRTAIERYSPRPTTLTAIHCDLIQVHTLTHTHTHTHTHRLTHACTLTNSQKYYT